MEHEARRVDTTRVLLVEENARTAALIAELLRAAGGSHVLARAERLSDGIQELLEYGASCVVLAIGDATTSLKPLQQLRSAAPDVPIVVVSERRDATRACEAIRVGAQDYLVQGELGATQLWRALQYAIERNRAELELAERALNDPLTGLPNRALFLDRMSVALDRARRTGATVAVLFLDIDDFKRINDSLGHAAGDRVLETLAHRLRSMLRPMDTVARFGGDEFTFLFEELSSEREALLIAERICRTAELPVALPGAETRVAVSIGITLANDPTSAPELVIREADAAMYRAKERDGPHYELFDEVSRQRADARTELEAALRRALERSELSVLYEPRVSLGPRDRRIVGFEARLHWQHPQRGLLGPGEFMPVAEESGLTLTVARYVVAEALRAQARWRELGSGATASVAVSSGQFQDPGLAALLEASRGDGLALTLSDFGTAESSIHRLMQLPVDLLELPPKFAPRGEDGQRQQTVLPALVGLAHALGCRALAGGIETDAQLEALRAAGCDCAQGPLLGAPATAEEAVALLARQQAS